MSQALAQSMRDAPLHDGRQTGERTRVANLLPSLIPSLVDPADQHDESSAGSGAAANETLVLPSELDEQITPLPPLTPVPTATTTRQAIRQTAVMHAPSHAPAFPALAALASSSAPPPPQPPPHGLRVTASMPSPSMPPPPMATPAPITSPPPMAHAAQGFSPRMGSPTPASASHVRSVQPVRAAAARANAAIAPPAHHNGIAIGVAVFIGTASALTAIVAALLLST